MYRRHPMLKSFYLTSEATKAKCLTPMPENSDLEQTEWTLSHSSRWRQINPNPCSTLRASLSKSLPRLGQPRKHLPRTQSSKKKSSRKKVLSCSIQELSSSLRRVCNTRRNLKATSRASISSSLPCPCSKYSTSRHRTSRAPTLTLKKTKKSQIWVSTLKSSKCRRNLRRLLLVILYHPNSPDSALIKKLLKMQLSLNQNK